MEAAQSWANEHYNRHHLENMFSFETVGFPEPAVEQPPAPAVEPVKEAEEQDA